MAEIKGEDIDITSDSDNDEDELEIYTGSPPSNVRNLRKLSKVLQSQGCYFLILKIYKEFEKPFLTF